MKKCVTLALVIMLVATVAVLLPGCGGDTKQAKQYMQNGIKLVKQLQEEQSTWQTAVSSSMTNISDQVAYQAAIDKAKASATSLSKTAGEAKAEFEKIKGLNGVDDYVKYANFQIAALDKFQEFITKTNSFFDQVIAMVKSGDITGLTSAEEAYTKEGSKLGEEMNKLDEEAQKLKADKNL